MLHGLRELICHPRELELFTMWIILVRVGKKKLNGKVDRTVVSPALIYEAETWALKKALEKKLEVAEMRMLRWMCGVTKLENI